MLGASGKPIRVDAAEPRDGDAEPRNWLAKLYAHPYSTAFVVDCLVLLALNLRKATTEFDWTFMLSAQNLVNGNGLYQVQVPPYIAYTYPPFMAMLVIPFASMPRLLGRGSWLVFVCSCAGFLCRGAWRLAGGGRLEGGSAKGIDTREHLVAALGLLCAYPYVESGLSHLQADPLIAALLIAGCMALERSRDLRAATCFGLAASMKCTPLLWVPYLAWRGRWRAAAWLVAVAVGVNLLPNLVNAPAGGGFWLVEWITRFLAPMTRPSYVTGQWYAWVLDNQSLAGTIGRWATTQLTWQAGSLGLDGRSHPLATSVLRPLIYGLEAALLLAAWYVLRRRVPDKQSAGTAAGALAAPFEYSVVLLLMLLLSPMSGRPHFATMLLPAFCLARVAVYDQRRGLFVLLLANAVLMVALLPWWGNSVGRLSMWWGFLAASAVLLLAGCLSVLVSEARGLQASHSISVLRGPHFRRDRVAATHSGQLDPRDENTGR